MHLRISLLPLIFLFCVVLVSSKNTHSFEELMDGAERNRVKRDIYKDITGIIAELGSAFSNIFDQMNDFLGSKYKSFKDYISEKLCKDLLQSLRGKLSEYYNKLTKDIRSSPEGKNLKGILLELDDLATAGSVSVKSTALVATVSVFLSILILH